MLSVILSVSAVKVGNYRLAVLAEKNHACLKNNHLLLMVIIKGKISVELGTTSINAVCVDTHTCETQQFSRVAVMHSIFVMRNAKQLTINS